MLLVEVSLGGGGGGGGGRAVASLLLEGSFPAVASAVEMPRNLFSRFLSDRLKENSFLVRDRVTPVAAVEAVAEPASTDCCSLGEVRSGPGGKGGGASTTSLSLKDWEIPRRPRRPGLAAAAEND